MGTQARKSIGRGIKTGGARRDRTADLLHAMQALSQLSYDPTWRRRTLPHGVHFVKKMNGLRAPKLLRRSAAKGGSSRIGKLHARSGHRLSCAASILFRSLSAEAAYLAENDHINRGV